MTLKRKIQTGLLALIAVFIATIILVSGVVERQIEDLNHVASVNDKIDNIYIKLANNAQAMQYNIVQVQQFLTDLGATRALISKKDADEDYKDAEKNAQSFLKLAAESKGLAKQASGSNLTFGALV